MTAASTEELDIEFLMAQPQFRRWALTVIQLAGILEPATNGSDTRNLAYVEGRRNLGFDILSKLATAQAVPDPEGHLTLFQLLRESIQQPPQESQRGNKRRQYDRNAELSDDDGDADKSAGA